MYWNINYNKNIDVFHDNLLNVLYKYRSTRMLVTSSLVSVAKICI